MTEIQLIGQQLTVRVIDQSSQKGIYDANVRIRNELNFKRSNVLGYVQIEAEAGDTLIISLNSYELGEIIIPDAKGFTVALARYYYELDSVNINASLNQLALYGSKSKKRLSSMTGVATYKRGWSNFYIDLASNIPNWNNLEDFDNTGGVRLNFTISKDGILSNAQVVDEGSGTVKYLSDALLKTQGWEAASFRDITYDQYFTIKLYGQSELLDKQAEPENGFQAFYELISQNMEYPEEAKKSEVKGKVYIEFTVDEKGELMNMNVIKGIGSGCDEEAIRAIKMAGRWNPALQNGRPVKQKITIPITFN